MSDTKVRLAELMACLSLAIDLGVGQPMEWVMRSCLLGTRLADAMGMDEAAKREVYYITLLRHLGCTSTASIDAELFGDELGVAELMTADPDKMGAMLSALTRLVGKEEHLWRRMAMLARIMSVSTGTSEAGRHAHSVAHCEVAQRLAATIGFEQSIQESLFQIYERWDGGGLPNRLKGDALSLAVRVCHVAQDAATFYSLGGREAAISVTRTRAGRLYDPAIVDTFCSSAPLLLQELDVASVWELVLASEPESPRELVSGQIDQGLYAVADFTDFKSQYTRGHSRAVAKLVNTAAALCGLPVADRLSVTYAAYLHDIGKVGVTAAIWDKSGALNESEAERVRMHPYLTERIFARSEKLAPIASLGAMHHERIDGSGYPRELPGSAQSVATKLLAAANRYCALLEERPHRPASTPDQAAARLLQEAREGRLDKEAVNGVLSAAHHRVEPPERKMATELTSREVEVLKLIAKGHPNRVVAKVLVISPKTVDNHIQSIYSKIHVSTRAGATLYAMQNGLLDNANPA
jgi:HD-GYP domain-containing protein (c-di-GMP phosphodiesterase class II)